jgi:23S rRNA pseudouridine1911/1915/1917 synthase
MADGCNRSRSEDTIDKPLVFQPFCNSPWHPTPALIERPKIETMDTTDSPLEILCQDGPCLVINKPSGLLTQAPAGIDSLEVRIKAFIKHQEQKTGNVYLGLPHRLDRPASGAIVFARHVRAARRLSKQFEDRSVSKIYWALVEGDIQPDEGTWTDYLHKRHGMAEAIVVPEDDPRGKQAVLHYRVMGRTAGVSWLEIELETGRTHQIRVQAASRGYPILGDGQ